MCSHTLRIDIAMHTLPCIEYPLFSFVRFAADKTSFLHSLFVDTFSVVKIQWFLHLVKEVSCAYNSPTLFCWDCGAVARLPRWKSIFVNTCALLNIGLRANPICVFCLSNTVRWSMHPKNCAGQLRISLRSPFKCHAIGAQLVPVSKPFINGVEACIN
jgi:hypothetical protein